MDLGHVWQQKTDDVYLNLAVPVAVPNLLCKKIMLAKVNRLPRLAIEDVRNSSLHVNSQHFLLLYTFVDDHSPRFGVIISKKISRKAVVRNRIKRIFYKTLKDNLDNIKPGASGVFIARPSIVDNLGSISSDVLDSLKRAKIVK